MRVATGCAKHTSTIILNAIAAEEPLSLKREYKAKKEIAKHITSNNIIAKQLYKLASVDANEKNLTYNEHIYLKFKNEFSIIAKNIKTIQPNNIFIKPYIPEITKSKANLSIQELRCFALKTISENYISCKAIFTDASKLNNKCGVGIYDAETQRKISTNLTNNVSIMTAELYAIYLATEYIKHHNYTSSVIFTDSQSTCKYLIKNQHQNIFNEITNKIFATKNLHIQWVPAHVGIHGKEHAD